MSSGSSLIAFTVVVTSLVAPLAQAQVDTGGFDAPPPAASPPPSSPSRDVVDRTDRWGTRNLAVLGQVGFGTPLGLIGVDVDYTPLRWLALTGGVGINPRGLQFALMPRVRVVLSQSLAMSFGAGASVGPYGTERHHYFAALWGNYDLALERRGRRPVQWRVFIGRAGVLASTEPSCGDYAYCDGIVRPLLIYVGFAMGYTLKI